MTEGNYCPPCKTITFKTKAAIDSVWLSCSTRKSDVRPDPTGNSHLIAALFSYLYDTVICEFNLYFKDSVIIKAKPHYVYHFNSTQNTNVKFYKNQGCRFFQCIKWTFLFSTNRCCVVLYSVTDCRVVYFLFNITSTFWKMFKYISN